MKPQTVARASLLGAGVSLLCAGLAACAPGTAQEPASAGHTQKDDKTSTPLEAEKKPALPMPAGKKVSFQRELNHVSELRNLAPRSKLQGLEVERQELLAHVQRAVDLEVPEKALRGTEAMLIGLGVVPPDFDYRATMLRLLSAKLAGLYDPHLKTMMIRQGLAPELRDMTLLHELVHALQDQNYDLSEVVEWTPDDTDRSGALSALAEGDATSAMFDGVMKNGATALTPPPGFFEEKMREEEPGPDGIPSIITRSLKASYIDGLSFVHQLRRRGGWDEVNRAWERPPTTTEQILHVDKYDSDEKGLTVSMPPPPQIEGWTMILHDIWGEQNLRLIFEEWMDLSEASEAAAGWGGDRIAAYEHQTGVQFVAWHLIGDDAKAGARMRAAFVSGLRRFDSENDGSCGPIADGRKSWCVAGEGTHLYVAATFLGPEASLEAQYKATSGYLLTQLAKTMTQSR